MGVCAWAKPAMMGGVDFTMNSAAGIRSKLEVNVPLPMPCHHAAGNPAFDMQQWSSKFLDWAEEARAAHDKSSDKSSSKSSSSSPKASGGPAPAWLQGDSALGAKDRSSTQPAGLAGAGGVGTATNVMGLSLAPGENVSNWGHRHPWRGMLLEAT